MQLKSFYRGEGTYSLRAHQFSKGGRNNKNKGWDLKLNRFHLGIKNILLKVKSVSALCMDMDDSPPSDAFGKTLFAHMEVILPLIQTIGLVLESTMWPKPDNSIDVNVPRPLQLL